ncbi:hypothetical protein ACHAQH_005258 [Verticillium albo-atrum]
MPDKAFSGSADDLLDKFSISSPPGVDIIHTKTYPAISPSRPEASQAVSRVILTGRRRDVVEKATAGLAAEFPKTEFLPLACDIASLEETFAFEPIITADLDYLWSEFVTNVRSQLDFAQRFRAQDGFEDKKKYLVYVASAVIHTPGLEEMLPSYVLTKKAGQIAIQTIANAADPKKFQIVIFHPGTILSETAVNAGMTPDSLPFDDVKLPADYGVWAATEEAAFLHGKFVWAAWDLGQLRSGEAKKRIESDPNYLTVRLVGP